MRERRLGAPLFTPFRQDTGVRARSLALWAMRRVGRAARLTVFESQNQVELRFPWGAVGYEDETVLWNRCELCLAALGRNRKPHMRLSLDMDVCERHGPVLVAQNDEGAIVVPKPDRRTARIALITEIEPIRRKQGGVHLQDLMGRLYHLIRAANDPAMIAINAADRLIEEKIGFNKLSPDPHDDPDLVTVLVSAGGLPDYYRRDYDEDLVTEAYFRAALGK